MSDLITRAEQGVLAAILAGDQQALLTERLAVTDFTDPTHQAVYQAIVSIDPAGRDLERLATTVAVLRPGVDAAWLRQLADSAPEPERASAYAQVLLQAAFEREAAGFGADYLAAAEQTTDQQTRDTLTRLGQAFTVRAEAFATIDADARTTIAVEVGAQMHREDQVIADLIQHPEQAVAVAAWLDSAVFTTEQRRITFEIAVSLAYDHDPIDAVILTWHVEQARAINSLYGSPPQVPDPGGESQYAYLTRLESDPVTPGTAVIVGRDLLADHVRASVALSATQAAERAAQAPVTGGQRVQQVGIEAPLSAPAHIDIRPIER